MTSDVGEDVFSAPALSATQGPYQPQWKQTKQWGPLPQVVPILAVEGAGVAARLLRGRVALRTTRVAATAAALPAHRLPVAPEAKAVADQTAAKHALRGYSKDTGP
jgi:hypothetical protein